MLSPAATLADAGSAFARLKAGVQAERAALQARFRENADGPAVLREHCRLIDRTSRTSGDSSICQPPSPWSRWGASGGASSTLIPTSTC